MAENSSRYSLAITKMPGKVEASKEDLHPHQRALHKVLSVPAAPRRPTSASLQNTKVQPARARKESTVSVCGKVPEMYLHLLASMTEDEAEGDNRKAGLAGQYPRLSVTDQPEKLNPSVHPCLGASSSWSSESIGQPSLLNGASEKIDHETEDEEERGFEINWERFQDALAEIRGRMRKHGGFYNVASTYFLLTYSGHGFKHWFLPMSFVRKTFWVAIVLFFLYCMIHQSLEVVKVYLDHPTSVSITVSGLSLRA